MLLNLFNEMRAAKVPVSVRELLDLHQALQKHVVFADMDEFYYLARAILVKDERHFDKFDRAFAAYFKGLENLDRHIEALIPEDWLRKEFERSLTDEERAQIQSLGGLDKLIEEFKKRLEERKGTPCRMVTSGSVPAVPARSARAVSTLKASAWATLANARARR